MKTGTSLLFILLFAGCVRGPRNDLKLLNYYKPGAPREQLAAELNAVAAKCLVSKTRPADGWPALRNKTNSKAETAAYQFEQNNPGLTVQTSEEYWVWREYTYTSPFSIPGVWLDYLFFDKDDKLLGYLRAFAD